MKIFIDYFILSFIFMINDKTTIIDNFCGPPKLITIDGKPTLIASNKTYNSSLLRMEIITNDLFSSDF